MREFEREWGEGERERLVQLIFYALCAALTNFWKIWCSIFFGNAFTIRFDLQDLLIKPHCIQILTLLCLTGYGKKSQDLENHVMQIRTGEGKSIALGGGAGLLALLGFRVRCVCYSQYLSQRDFKAFSTLFDALGVQNRIIYSTITSYSNLPKNAKVCLKSRTCWGSCMRLLVLSYVR